MMTKAELVEIIQEISTSYPQRGYWFNQETAKLMRLSKPELEARADYVTAPDEATRHAASRQISDLACRKVMRKPVRSTR